MMTEGEHLLIILAEECAEMAKEISKVLRFGRHEQLNKETPTNIARVQHEFFDLMVMANMCGLSAELDHTHYMKKREAVIKYMDYSRNLLHLTGERNYR